MDLLLIPEGGPLMRSLSLLLCIVPEGPAAVMPPVLCLRIKPFVTMVAPSSGREDVDNSESLCGTSFGSWVKGTSRVPLSLGWGVIKGGTLSFTSLLLVLVGEPRSSGSISASTRES